MSLSIYKSPAPITFSGNPIVFGVKDTNALSVTNERPCISSLRFNIPINNTVYWRIRIFYGSYSVQLEFGNELPFTGSYTMVQWVAACRDAMRAIYDLNSRFFIESDVQTLFLVEREILGNIEFQKQNIYTNITVNNSLQKSSFFDTSGFHLIGCIPHKPEELELPAVIGSKTVYVPFSSGVELTSDPYILTDDINGRTGDGSRYIETRVEGMLRDKKTGHFNVLDKYVVYDIAERFAMEFHVRKEEGIVETLLSSEFRVIDAKISKVTQAEVNEMDISLWQYVQNNKMPLTWAPDTKKTDIYNPELLYFIAPLSLTFNVFCKEYFANGEITTTNIQNIVATQYQAILLSTAFLNVRTVDPNAALVKYKIWVEDDDTGDIILSPRTYIMDYDYQKQPRWWLFKNSFGIYETVRTTGKAVKATENVKQFIEKDLPDKYTTSDRDKEQTGVESNFVMEVQSGPKTKQEARNFIEFIESEDVYQLSNGKALPVIVYNGSFKLDDDNTNLENITFKVEANNLDSEHVSLDITLPVPGDFNGDFDEGFKS